MSTHLKEKEEKILDTLEKIGDESIKGIPIIVEGKKDKQALRQASIMGRIIEAKTGGKSILEVINEINSCNVDKVILLLDFDRRGKEWTKRLVQHLETMQIKPNITFWNRLRKIIGHEVKDIEGLSRYLETLRNRICNS
ncbi:MAG: toprim domain-containing protein [Candidatus Bathyarchaeota archaeon]|jgi:2,5-diamino-6-(ribosylamino)-4(3H)-pyrimidinone 5'-phosphate reductase